MSDRPTDEQIESFRRIGLRVDRDGRFWHQGEPVAHAGLARALARWLDVLPDGRLIVRLDERRYAYVEADDTPLVARSARVEGDRIRLHLSDDTEEPLDPATLARRGDDFLCRARAGRLDCRLAPQAVYALADHLRDEDGRVVLVLGAARHVIADARR